MHKKSGEAAIKLKEVEARDDRDDTCEKDKDNLRCESIASLRAKAQEHIAKTTSSHQGRSHEEHHPLITVPQDLSQHGFITKQREQKPNLCSIPINMECYPSNHR